MLVQKSCDLQACVVFIRHFSKGNSFNINMSFVFIIDNVILKSKYIMTQNLTRVGTHSVLTSNSFLFTFCHSLMVQIYVLIKEFWVNEVWNIKKYPPKDRKLDKCFKRNKTAALLATAFCFYNEDYYWLFTIQLTFDSTNHYDCEGAPC